MQLGKSAVKGYNSMFGGREPEYDLGVAHKSGLDQPKLLPQ